MARNTYLLRFSRPHTGLGPTEKVYTLGVRGRDFLHAQGYYRPYKIAHLSYSTLTHDLALTRFCVAASRFSRTNPDVKLSEMRLCYAIARDAPTVAMTTQGRETTRRIIPDAWLKFAILQNGTHQHFRPVLLEIDHGTQAGSTIRDRLRARLEWIRSGGYRRWAGLPSLVIAYATLGEYRDARAGHMCLG